MLKDIAPRPPSLATPLPALVGPPAPRVSAARIVAITFGMRSDVTAARPLSPLSVLGHARRRAAAETAALTDHLTRLDEAVAVTIYDLALVTGTVTGMGILTDFTGVTGLTIALALSTPDLLMMLGVAMVVRTFSNTDAVPSTAGHLMRLDV